jgi:hypothetical protein
MKGVNMGDKFALETRVKQRRDIQHFDLDPRNPDYRPEGYDAVSNFIEEEVETRWSDGSTTIEHRRIDKDGNVVHSFTRATTFTLGRNK